jgi:hypothetical protein
MFSAGPWLAALQLMKTTPLLLALMLLLSVSSACSSYSKPH